jgi:two-component system, NarL family, nitrate/nitrite response regulator NarL
MRTDGRDFAQLDAGNSASAFDTSTEVRLFIVSGLRFVREGLVRSIGRRKGISVVGSGDFAAAVPPQVFLAEPDVVAIDIAEQNGFEAARAIRAGSGPATKLVAFSVADTRDAVFACAAAGFSGYVTRDAEVDDLVRAVREARAGLLTCSPHMTAALFDHLSQLMQRSDPAADNVLTPREDEIIDLVHSGCSNKEIARELDISPATVKNHIHNILAKLKVDRRAKAAAVARP